jgi:hypothetical protein
MIVLVEQKFHTEDEKPKNLGFELVHPKNVLLASGIPDPGVA